MSRSLAGESLHMVAPFTASPSVWLLGVASGMYTVSTGLGVELLGSDLIAELRPAVLSLDIRLGGFGGMLGFKGTFGLGGTVCWRGVGTGTEVEATGGGTLGGKYAGPAGWKEGHVSRLK